MHGWYSEEPERFRRRRLHALSPRLHFYDSVLVVEKRPIAEPVTSITGKPSFPL